MVSEEKMFKECGRRRRTTEVYLSYKLPKSAFGSGELKSDPYQIFSSIYVTKRIRKLHNYMIDLASNLS